MLTQINLNVMEIRSPWNVKKGLKPNRQNSLVKIYAKNCREGHTHFEHPQEDQKNCLG